MSRVPPFNSFDQEFKASSNSLKYNQTRLIRGRDNPAQQLFAMDIADMDFPVDPRIKQKLIEKISECRDFTYKSFDKQPGNNAQIAIKNWYSSQRHLNV
jgi:bifunctional pyridoxal-dependent enzyme with beta-cystathionase and maltose regulon repressor activities